MGEKREPLARRLSILILACILEFLLVWKIFFALLQSISKNTHMHKLAQDLTVDKKAPELQGISSLIVHSEGESRSFKIEVAPPEGSSYARDIAEKYGVTYDKLILSSESLIL